MKPIMSLSRNDTVLVDGFFVITLDRVQCLLKEFNIVLYNGVFIGPQQYICTNGFEMTLADVENRVKHLNGETILNLFSLVQFFIPSLTDSEYQKVSSINLFNTGVVSNIIKIV